MSGVSLGPGPAVPFASNTLHKIPAHNTILETYKHPGDLLKIANLLIFKLINGFKIFIKIICYEIQFFLSLKICLVLSDMFWLITRNLNVRSNCDSDPTCNNISEFRMVLNFDGE